MLAAGLCLSIAFVSSHHLFVLASPWGADGIPSLDQVFDRRIMVSGRSSLAAAIRKGPCFGRTDW